MSDRLEVRSEDLTQHARRTLDRAEDLAGAWRSFLSSSAAPADAFGTSPGATELAGASLKAAHAADAAVSAVVMVLQDDVDGLTRSARNYEDLENDNDGLIGSVRDFIADGAGALLGALVPGRANRDVSPVRDLLDPGPTRSPVPGLRPLGPGGLTPNSPFRLTPAPFLNLDTTRDPPGPIIIKPRAPGDSPDWPYWPDDPDYPRAEPREVPDPDPGDAGDPA